MSKDFLARRNVNCCERLQNALIPAL